MTPKITQNQIESEYFTIRPKHSLRLLNVYSEYFKSHGSASTKNQNTVDTLHTQLCNENISMTI